MRYFCIGSKHHNSHKTKVNECRMLIEWYCCLLTCHYCEHAPYLMYMYQPCFFCLMFNVWEEHLLIKSVFSNVVDVKNINLNSSNCFQYNFLSISIYDCWLSTMFFFKISTIFLKSDWLFMFCKACSEIFLFWYNLCSERTSAWTFRIYY